MQNNNSIHNIARTALLLLVMMLSTTTAWADQSGQCGTDAWYHYYSSTQTLEVYRAMNNGSSGAMSNYEPYGNYMAPWSNLRNQIKNVVVEEGVTDIGRNAFYGCTALTEVSIASSVTEICNNAFEGCDKLQTVNFASESTLTRIDVGAFFGCQSLGSIDLPATVTIIEDHAFMSSGLTSFTIPDGVTSIGISLFEGCSSLQSIDIPNTMTSIGERAFLGCSSLTSVTIPSSVTSIGRNAFEGCSSLSRVTIADGVDFIDEDAFRCCFSLASITIPSSVTGIGWNVFYDCYNLTTVYCYAAIPPSIGGGVFGNNASSRKFYVPNANVETYKQYWIQYSGDIVGIDVYQITLNVSPDNTFGTAKVSTATATKGDKVTLTAIPNTGYRLVWWDVTGGGVVANPSAEQTTMTMPKRDVTVTAIFRGTEDNPDTHTLTLDNNTGDYSSMATSIPGIKSYTLPTRTRQGYIFLGWATLPTGEPVYQADETIELGGDLTLYAIWLETPVVLYEQVSNAATLQYVIKLGIPVDVCIGRMLYKDNHWNTLCLPFDVIDGDTDSNHLEESGGADGKTFTGTPLEGAVAMELDVNNEYDGHKTGFDASTGTLYLYFMPVNNIEAGKPYLVKWTTGTSIVDPIFTGVTLNAQYHNRYVYDNSLVFQGIFNPIMLKGDDRSVLYLGDDDKLYYPNQDMKLYAFRAYFQLNGITAGDPTDAGSKGISSIVLNFGDDEATGIENVQSSKLNVQSSAWYDLSGRRLNGKPTAKGLYIHGGRKVIVK